MGHRYVSILSESWTLACFDLLIYQDTGESVSVLVVDEDTVELPKLKDDKLWKVSSCGS